MSGTTIKRYVILTPFDKPEVVAGILALHGIDARVVQTDSGALVVRDLPEPQYDEWDIRNITGPDEADEDDDLAPSDNAPMVAAVLSKLSRYGVVLIDVDLGSDVGIEEGVSGLTRARRFLDGRAGEEISAGLLLNTVDPLVERVVLGQEDPEGDGGIRSGEVTTSMIANLVKGRRTRGRGKGVTGPLDDGEPPQDGPAGDRGPGEDPRPGGETPDGGAPPRGDGVKRRVVVLDAGTGNVRSAVRALERAGADVRLTAEAEAVMDADGLVVPGVGAFGTVMDKLRAVGADRLIERRLAGGLPVLGICVGLQVLFESSRERGHHEGLGQWPGTVERLDAPVVPSHGLVPSRSGGRLPAVRWSRGRALLLRPLLRRPLRPERTPGRARRPAAGDVGPARNPIRRRGRGRPAQRHPVPPREIVGRRGEAARQLALHPPDDPPPTPA